MPLLQSKRLQILTGEIIYLVGAKQVGRLTYRRNNISTSKSCIDMNNPPLICRSITSLIGSLNRRRTLCGERESSFCKKLLHSINFQAISFTCVNKRYERCLTKYGGQTVEISVKQIVSIHLNS